MSQRVVLLLQQGGDGPPCKVREISQVEVICLQDDSQFIIEHYACDQQFVVSGVGMHEITIPPGIVRVRRSVGNSPATVYAWS